MLNLAARDMQWTVVQCGNRLRTLAPNPRTLLIHPSFSKITSHMEIAIVHELRRPRPAAMNYCKLKLFNESTLMLQKICFWLIKTCTFCFHTNLGI